VGTVLYQFMRYIFLLLSSALILCGCSSSGTPSSFETWARESGKVKVLSTTAMIDDLVGEVGKDRVSHLPLITGDIDPHSYELVKGDDEKLHLADIIFYNGLGLEHGASLRYQLEHHEHSIAVGNAVLECCPERILHVGSEIDPHLWMDISLWSYIIDPIVEALSQIDPEGKESYERNGKLLREKMGEKHEQIYQLLQGVPEEKRYLVTSHDAFNYFTRAYLATPQEKTQAEWQKRCEAPEGLAPEEQLSAADIQKIITHILRYQIGVVFPETNVSRDSLKKVVHACAQKGLTVKISSTPLYADTMGAVGSGAANYLDMIAHDADVLAQAWNEE